MYSRTLRGAYLVLCGNSPTESRVPVWDWRIYFPPKEFRVIYRAILLSPNPSNPPQSHVQSNRSIHAQAEGGQTTIGRLHTYRHGKGTCPRSREREKDVRGHVQEEWKGKEGEREVSYLKTSRDYLCCIERTELVIRYFIEGSTSKSGCGRKESLRNCRI